MSDRKPFGFCPIHPLDKKMNDPCPWCEIEKLEQRIQDREDKFNAPCADALQKLWKEIMPEGYGDWEYPGQAYRHIKAEFEELKKKLKNNRARLERLIDKYEDKLELGDVGDVY